MIALAAHLTIIHINLTKRGDTRRENFSGRVLHGEGEGETHGEETTRRRKKGPRKGGKRYTRRGDYTGREKHGKWGRI